MTTFYIHQFGCRATQADGAANRAPIARTLGCTAASESASADVVVVNTCTVTASADAQARDAIRSSTPPTPPPASSSPAAMPSAPPKSLPLFPASLGLSAIPTSRKSPVSCRPFRRIRQLLDRMAFSQPPLWKRTPCPPKSLPAIFLNKMFCSVPRSLAEKGTTPAPP